ncbi:MAG: restriction endonuclease subunit S [Gallionellaceae bacterium]
MSPGIDITTEQRKTLLALLRSFIPGVVVWAYGSRVKWTARPNSDLDLVAFTAPEQSTLVSELKDALAESDLPFLVDFHVWNEVPERFHEIIRKEYVVLQEAYPEIGLGMSGSGFKACTLGDIAEFRNGKALSPNMYLPYGQHPVFGSNGQIARTNEVLTKDPLVVIGRVGAYCGSVHYVAESAWVSDNAIIATGKNQTDVRFLYYLLGSLELRRTAIGSAQPLMTQGGLKVVPTIAPPLVEQKTIAHILGTLDDKIELNRRMNATLESMAQALFKSWFVDFDPVRAKLDARKPAGLDAATAALFPAHFQESPLGGIPQGWAIKTIEELSERVAMGPFGSDIKISTFAPEGIPVISGQHLRGTLLDDSEFNFVTVEHADRLKRSNVQRGDVIFTHAGSIGQVAYIPETSHFERYIISQRQFYMRCNRSVMSPFYIASYFKTPEGQHRLLANTSSTGVPSISQPVTYLRQLAMVVPPLALLKIFDAAASGIHLRMAHNDQQSHTLATLRDALLPKLLSGEVKVPEIQSTSHQPHLTIGTN